MSALWAANVIAYAIQLAVLVASALLVTTVARLHQPRPALYFWQAIFIVSLVLPFIQSTGIDSAPALLGSAQVIGYALAQPSEWLGARNVALVLSLLMCVSTIRLVWIMVGLMRLNEMRRRSQPFAPVPDWVDAIAERVGAAAELRVSDDVDTPVTIGARRPLILLPRRALALPLAIQQGVVCHELIHVRRRDWLSTVVEHAWAALLWFHPAARVVASRLHLMREAVVDRETVAITGNRRAYAKALLTFAEPSLRTPSAVPSLIRPRHLAQRIALLSQETPMSHRHLAAALIAGIALVSTATAASISHFPMTQARDAGSITTASSVDRLQEAPVRPGNGVTAPRVVKDVKPLYTPEAMQAKIQGSVEVEVVVQADGIPTDVTISRSLDAVYGLDDAALRAAAQWTFEPGRRNGKPVPVIVAIEMAFRLK